jgi:hypothetical protein
MIEMIKMRGRLVREYLESPASKSRMTKPKLELARFNNDRELYFA